MRRVLLLLGVLLLLDPALRGEAPARTHAITVADYFTQAELFDAALSPDGAYVAYTEGRWQPATDDRKTDLWVVPTRGGAARRLTFDRANDRAPRWSPDGRWIYFLGSRQREGEKHAPYHGKVQVWRLGVDGGEPFAVTRLDDGVLGYDLAADGQSVYYQTQHAVIEDPWKELRERYRSIEYGAGVYPFAQIWKLDLQSWRAEKVIDDRRVVRDFAVSPTGRIAMITTPDDKVVSFEGQSRVDVYDPQTGKISPVPDRSFRAEAPSSYGWLEGLAWSADGRSLAFNVIFDGYPAEIILAEWGAGTRPTTGRLRRPAGLSIRGYGSPLHWRGGTDLCFLGEEKARVRLYRVSDAHPERQGALHHLTPGDVVVQGFSLSRSGEQAAVVLCDPTHTSDVYLVEGTEKPRRLTTRNPQVDTWKIPNLSVVSWKGAHGDAVEGILQLPPDHVPGRRLPLVVAIHGGPTTADYYGLQYGIYGHVLLPAQGYAVLNPNYRGSTGYGDKFLTDLVGHENEVEVEDILKGVDALVERGIADPERLGVMGWSNGGYLTNCLISKTTRFKAASSGAGIVDMVMEWGANDEPAYTYVFRRGFPWNQAEAYRATSPTYGLDKVRTPTLIHVGGADERCIPGQSRMLYRALKEYVKVPTELLVYPGEPHGLLKYSNRKAKMEWDLAWFERYLRANQADRP